MEMEIFIPAHLYSVHVRSMICVDCSPFVQGLLCTVFVHSFIRTEFISLASVAFVQFSSDVR